MTSMINLTLAKAQLTNKGHASYIKFIYPLGTKIEL